MTGCRGRDACPPREQLDDRRIVLRRQSFPDCVEECLPRRSRERRIDAETQRKVGCDPDILGKDARRRARRIVASQRTAHAILEDPACAGARAHDVEDALWIEAGLPRERHRLGAGGEVRGGEQVVDDLERGGVAGALAYIEHGACDRGEHRRTSFAGRARARGHDRHRACRRLRRAAGDGCIDQFDSCGGKARCEPGHVVRVHRGRDDDDPVRGIRADEAVGAEQDRFDLAIVDDEQDGDRGCRGHLFRRAHHRGAEACRFRVGLGPDVARKGRDALAAQRAHDTQPHRSGADDPNHRRCHGCDRCGCGIIRSNMFGSCFGTMTGLQSSSGRAKPSCTSCSSVPLPRSSINPFV